MSSDPARPLAAAELQRRYGPGYFRGENSGFSPEGYERVHASWRHWMPFVRAEVGAGARWLDLGCAYGFLVEEAREAGFRAIGLDASRFAVSQARAHAPLAAGRVVAALAEALPFADGSFGVVSAFDLLEHVPDPERVLAEAARVLRAGGLLLAATPDPLLFDRLEPTHVAERVPSWWVDTLERAGFDVTFRFFQAPFNCELVARRGGRAPAISYDRLGRDPVLAASGLVATFRSGVGAPEPDGARVIEDGALVYLLNPDREPAAVRGELTLESARPGRVTVRLDGRVVARIEAAAGALDLDLLLPTGGHHLRLGLEVGWARLRRLRLEARPAARERLLGGLPFDLYQRYALAAEVVRAVAPDARSLLDVGGAMAGAEGHLAHVGDFFPELAAESADERGLDHPRHVRLAAGSGLPFEDRSFDVVSAQDVLEHVPAGSRERWLDEVWRVTGRLLLLGNPFATPGVAEADRYLLDLIRRRYGYEHRFLAEHLGFGHPDLDATRRFFLARGASVCALPSLGLSSWLLLQTLNATLSHPEQDGSFIEANRAANAALGPGLTDEAPYRYLLVVDREGGRHAERLRELSARARSFASERLRGWLRTRLEAEGGR